MKQYLTISQISNYLKLKITRDPYLERVYLTGEVSNFRERPGHQYFSLKDDKSVIRATMWSGNYKKLNFSLEEGMKVNVVGRIELFEPQGSYSIILESVEPDGVGALAVKLEQLKQKLQAEGLFNLQHKQALPQFSRKVGVVTSPSGAVIRDIITTVSRRFPGVDILLFPAKVQGTGSAEDVARMIKLANQREDLDLLIVGRGGGSIEDLWAFNEEVVVRAIFESRLPVISSVGHETDTTLADYVADQRAATPTAAAELATPNTKADMINWIKQAQSRLYSVIERKISYERERLNAVAKSVIFRQPERLYDGYLQRLDLLENQLKHHVQQQLIIAKQSYQLASQSLQSVDLVAKMERYMEQIQFLEANMKRSTEHILTNKKTNLDRLSETLLTLDTSRIVARGYAMVKRDNQVIQGSKDVNVGDQLTIEMKDGELEVEVKDVK